MLDEPLNPVEIRILGALIEKQHATPEYYPLTLNALAAACNQTTNREPVMALGEGELAAALEALRQKRLVWFVAGAGSRTTKYEQKLSEDLNLALQEVAALAVLMLRGPQTAGEIRSRAGRLYSFADLGEVEAALDSLGAAEPPLVLKLPRQPGTKESRYAHLLAGAPELDSPVVELPAQGLTRVEQLQAEVAQLREELRELREAFQAFRRELE
jgi:uncharacterized protein YceH (UPF0502 family)